MRNNNPQSAYVTHILNHHHQLGTIQNTMNLVMITQKTAT